LDHASHSGLISDVAKSQMRLPTNLFYGSIFCDGKALETLSG